MKFIKSTASHIIETATYISKFKAIEQNLLYFERHHYYSPPQTEIDIFGNFWIFGIADVRPDTVFYSKENKYFSINGKVGILIPPFSIIEWKINTTNLIWNAFVWNTKSSKSQISLQEKFTEACYCTWDEEILPQSSIELENSILKDHHWIPISKIDESSTLALRAKNTLDSNLGDSISIGQIAADLGITSYNLTRTFKKTYGITPIVYRNKSRIFDSMIRLLFNQSKTIAETGFDVGFSDLSRFNKEFSKFISAKPSQYHRKNIP